jgi:uncharacterized protein DUF4105
MLRTRYPLLAVCVLALVASARAVDAQANAKAPPASPPARSLTGAVPQVAPAVQPDPLHQAGQNVTISLLTMGNGEQVWELFGHNGLWIHDNVTNRDTVFNWGVFSFHQEHFIPHFLQGRMLYSMGGDSMEDVLRAYQYWNRSVLSQELDLTAAQKDSILTAIQRNALPENINYRYDYYRDNCSTRVRDILDRALGGPLSVQAAGLTDATYRWHSLRLMQGIMPIMLGVDIGLGRPADVRLTKWQEMFLPRKLHDFVAKVRVMDSTGAMKPLVRSERVLFQSTREPEPTAPPDLGLWLLFAGVIVAAVMTSLGFMATPLRPGFRLVAAALTAAWSLAAGLLGTVLVLLWAATDHVFAHSNENVLLFNPLWLGLAVMLPVYLWSGRWEAPTRRLTLVIVVLALTALGLHVLGISRQENVPLIGLVLPPALGFMAITVRARWAPIPRRVPPLAQRQA